MFGYQVAILLATTIIIPCTVGIIVFRKLPLHYKFVVAMLVVGFVSEISLFALPYLGLSNFLSSHIYALFEILLLSLFFRFQFKTKREKKIIWIAMIGLSAFAVVYSAIGNNIVEFNSVPRALECIYFSVLSCYLFYEISMDTEPISDSIYFVNGAILFYFSSCFIVFAFSKYKSPDYGDLLAMHNVHSIVSTICNIAYAVGLWIVSRSSYSVA